MLRAYLISSSGWTRRQDWWEPDPGGYCLWEGKHHPKRWEQQHESFPAV